MVGAGDLDVDRKLGVEVGHLFRRCRLEQLKLQAAAESGLVDVRQQRIHLGLIGQLLEQGTE